MFDPSATMSDKEREAYQKFSAYHFATCLAKPVVKYTGVGIGTVIEVTCPRCLQEENITDYESW